jgi:hypothetical protein
METPDKRPDFNPVAEVKSRLLFFAIVVIAMIVAKVFFGF